jgi:integrase
VPKSRWTILSPVEIAVTLNAFDRLIATANTNEERAWRETCRTMVFVFVYAWLRRGELLGLLWRDVELAHPDGPRLHVRRAWVRGSMDTPKTDEETRTIALPSVAAVALFEHQARSRYDAPDDLVFPHPLKALRSRAATSLLARGSLSKLRALSGTSASTTTSATRESRTERRPA